MLLFYKGFILFCFCGRCFLFVYNNSTVIRWTIYIQVQFLRKYKHFERKTEGERRKCNRMQCCHQGNILE